MAGPPSKKWKGREEVEDLNDSFDEDDEILDGPSHKFNQLMSQRTQHTVTQPSRPVVSLSSTVSHSTPPKVNSTRVTPGQTAYKTTPTSSRIRPSAFPPSSSTTPTSSYESQNSISQGEYIAVKYQLANAQREKDELKLKLVKSNEEWLAEKKRMEEDKKRVMKRMEEKMKMAEVEVNALRMSNASFRAETSLTGGDLNQSIMSVSSVGSSQRMQSARSTHSVPRLSGGNGFQSEIAATFAHNQTMRMDEDFSFQDVPSQAFDNEIDSAPILDRILPIEKKVETADVKLQTDLDKEGLLDITPFSYYILSSVSTVAECSQLDDELYFLLEKLVKDPSEPDLIEIGDSQFSPLCSQEVPSQASLDSPSTDLSIESE